MGASRSRPLETRAMPHWWRLYTVNPVFKVVPGPGWPEWPKPSAEPGGDGLDWHWCRAGGELGGEPPVAWLPRQGWRASTAGPARARRGGGAHFVGHPRGSARPRHLLDSPAGRRRSLEAERSWKTPPVPPAQHGALTDRLSQAGPAGVSRSTAVRMASVRAEPCGSGPSQRCPTSNSLEGRPGLDRVLARPWPPVGTLKVANGDIAAQGQVRRGAPLRPARVQVAACLSAGRHRVRSQLHWAPAATSGVQGPALRRDLRARVVFVQWRRRWSASAARLEGRGDGTAPLDSEAPRTRRRALWRCWRKCWRAVMERAKIEGQVRHEGTQQVPAGVSERQG